MSDIDWNELAKDFPYEDLEWRIQRSGKKSDRVWALVVPYVTNRAIMQRLDDVVGPANWQNHFTEAPGGGILCGIEIRVGDSWVCKWDGAEQTDIEKVKGGLSAAMKRAAVQWGMGRHLYALDAMFAHVGDNAKTYAKTKDGTPFRWNPPSAEEMGGKPEPKAEPKDEKPIGAPMMTAGQIAQIKDLGKKIKLGSDPSDEEAQSTLEAARIALKNPKHTHKSSAAKLIEGMEEWLSSALEGMESDEPFD